MKVSSTVAVKANYLKFCKVIFIIDVDYPLAFCFDQLDSTIVCTKHNSI